MTAATLATSAALMLACLHAAPAQEALTVAATSPRPGLVFTDTETPEISAAVQNAAGDATVAFTVRETEGPWEQEGAVAVAVREGKGEAALPLELPGRGLYQLSLTASCGEAAASSETTVAVVFTPPEPDPESPWGIFFTPPRWVRTEGLSDAEAAALSHRLLGASWSRLNFWAHSFGKVTIEQRDGKPYVTADYLDGRWKDYAGALRAQGIHIMGEIAQCPGVLSSRQGDKTSDRGDAGEMQSRVKPRDYAEWDSLMENLARDFAEEIDYWEIWNEVNLVGGYWAGTQEELLELVQHTSEALRRGNPEAKILGCGFVHGHDYADRMLGLGMGKYIDILSVHYTDESPQDITRWHELLARHNLAIPIWNTEERSEVPLNNLAGGIVRSFKFMHINTGYESFRLLVNPDFTARPPAIWYSVGAHCIGTAEYVETARVAPGLTGYFFQRDQERILAISGHPLGTLFGATAPTLIVAAEPLTEGDPITVTDRYGRSRRLSLADGRGAFDVSSSPLFVNGARNLSVVDIQAAAAGGALVAEAEGGDCSPGWGRNAKSGFSGDRILEIWTDADPGPEGYWAEVKLTVPQAGDYEVLFSGNSLTRLDPPRSISPFTWSFDGGQEYAADGALPVATDLPGSPEGISTLGRVRLAAGEHSFRLRLTGPRDTPDHHYALWFDAIALRPVEAD